MMQIIKPYGRSFADKAERKIQRTNAENDGPIDIAKLMAEDKLLIAQWIGVIDKIISKPKEGRRNSADAQQAESQTEELRENREILGKAAWQYLLKKNRLKAPGEMKNIWQRKLSATQLKAPRDDKGRWHGAFIGFMPLNSNFAESVVKKIDVHLMERSLSIRGEKKQKRIGLSQHRGNAVAKNTLYNAADRQKKTQNFVSKADWEIYSRKADNFAQEIREAILTVWKPQTDEEKKQEKGYKTPPYNIAVEILKKRVWPRLFGDGVAEFAGADKQDRRLLQIHQAVKETYKRLLKGHKRLDNVKLAKILRADNKALFCLLQNKKQNQSLNHLIRLGKIIHYTASKKEIAEGDSTAFIIGHWPTENEVQESDFWTSAGQTHIKQNEAVVRVWRRALAFAARGLKGLTDTVCEIDGDILIGKKQKEILAAFQTASESCFKNFEEKYRLLFSDDAEEKCGVLETVPEKKEITEFALTGLAALRNAAFHFKGMRSFVAALRQENKEILPKAVSKLYTDAQAYYRQQLKAVMEAAFFHNFFGDSQIGKIWEAVNAPLTASALPLPRLKRVLERAEDAWKGEEKLVLPLYSTAEARQGKEEDAHWLHCQYTALKLLYDKPFNAWFAGQTHEQLQTYLEKAITHTTAAAKRMNGGKDKYKELIAAKADGLEKLKPGEQADSFFSKLIAATATEFRVQNGYASNGDNAKKQAEYIEKFKCDIVALALADYLPAVIESMELFCRKERRETGQSFSYESLPNGEIGKAEPWQKRLYFLLHFMPVEEAGSLRHQLKKWQIVTRAEKMEGERANEKAEQELLAKLLAVFDLYIALHDAQFMAGGKGGRQLSELEPEEYQEYFENPKDFDLVFKKQDGQENLQAFRGLREMQRFGGDVLKYLSDKDAIPQEHKVRHSAIDEWKKQNGTVADAQNQRIGLHEEWIEAGKKKQDRQWIKDKGSKYAGLVQEISCHQQLTAEVMLQNPLRLHRLALNVLGRLTDFSGLFERDLYFTLLALLHKKQQKENASEEKNWFAKQFDDITEIVGTALPQEECQIVGSSFLERGQIVEAFYKLTEETADIKGSIKKLFRITGADTSYEEKDGKKYKLCFKESNKRLKHEDYIIWVRNRFAHLAALECCNLPVNLTEEVNKARDLMAYDRKLKNAVTQSIIKMLDQEGLKLQWDMNDSHRLEKAKVSAKLIKHLGGAKAIDKNDKGQIIKQPVTELRHGSAYVTMIKALFGDKA